MRRTSKAVRQAAKRLRRDAMPAERALWRVLRQRAVNGLRFRRQHPVDGLVLDFYCAECKLCVEVDGEVHEAQEERDAARTEKLALRGIRVLRFPNETVLTDMSAVLRAIVEASTQPR